METLHNFKATITEVASTSTDAGTFSAVVAVFGNVGKAGDRLMPGAFTDTLARWRDSGKRIPVIYSHNWDDPAAIIGYADPELVHETEAGLVMTASPLDSAEAQGVRQAMVAKAISEFSFGYRIVSERRGSDGANELLAVDLIEAGPCLVGVNPATQLLAVKAVAETTEPSAELVAYETELSMRIAADAKAAAAGAEMSPRVKAFLAEQELEHQHELEAKAAKAERDLEHERQAEAPAPGQCPSCPGGGPRRGRAGAGGRQDAAGVAHADGPAPGPEDAKLEALRSLPDPGLGHVHEAGHLAAGSRPERSLAQMKTLREPHLPARRSARLL